MSTDRFGHPIDLRAGYAWDDVLRDHDDEVHRMLTGRAVMKVRVERAGVEAVFNMTGLVRASPLLAEDLAGLTSQLPYYARWSTQADELAVEHTGGATDSRTTARARKECQDAIHRDSGWPTPSLPG